MIIHDICKVNAYGEAKLVSNEYTLGQNREPDSRVFHLILVHETQVVPADLCLLSSTIRG